MRSCHLLVFLVVIGLALVLHDGARAKSHSDSSEKEVRSTSSPAAANASSKKEPEHGREEEEDEEEDSDAAEGSRAGKIVARSPAKTTKAPAGPAIKAAHQSGGQSSGNVPQWVMTFLTRDPREEEFGYFGGIGVRFVDGLVIGHRRSLVSPMFERGDVETFHTRLPQVSGEPVRRDMKRIEMHRKPLERLIDYADIDFLNETPELNGNSAYGGSRWLIRQAASLAPFIHIYRFDQDEYESKNPNVKLVLGSDLSKWQHDVPLQATSPDSPAGHENCVMYFYKPEGGDMVFTEIPVQQIGPQKDDRNHLYSYYRFEAKDHGYKYTRRDRGAPIFCGAPRKLSYISQYMGEGPMQTWRAISIAENLSKLQAIIREFNDRPSDHHEMWTIPE